MNRQQKLAKIRELRTSKEFMVLTNGEPFIEALGSKIESLKDILGMGTELTNLDELSEELSKIQSVAPELEALKKSIDGLSFPTSVEVNGLDSLIKAFGELNKKDLSTSIDPKPFELINKNLGQLIQKIEKLQVPKQGQKPEDYIPTRRVMKVGNTMMYDDSFYTGGGGGGSGIAQYVDSNGVTQNVGPNYPLPTTATISGGDIEIGAVELKNATTDDRVAVVNIAPTTEFGVVTRNIPSGTQTVDTELPAASTLADGTTNPSVPGVADFGMMWDSNATSWARRAAWRHGLNVGANTGMTPSVMMGEFDEVSPSAVTENQSATLRMSSNRNLYGTIRDAAGNERGANVNASNQLSVSVDNATVGTLPATSSVTSVADTASSTTLLSSNASRKGGFIVNDSSAALYIKYGTTASTTDYTDVLFQYERHTITYSGRIDGIWATDPNVGSARITEIT